MVLLRIAGYGVSVKMTKRRFIVMPFFVGLCALTAAPAAFAYVDPNSAGVLYQFLFPVVVAVGLAWRWVKQMAKDVWSRITRKVS
jgi:hypothetical protein